MKKQLTEAEIREIFAHTPPPYGSNLTPDDIRAGRPVVEQPPSRPVYHGVNWPPAATPPASDPHTEYGE